MMTISEWRVLAARLHRDESGERPIEVALILLAMIAPIYYSFEMLLEILSEYLAFEIAIITSPFF